MIEDLASYHKVFDRVTESRVIGDDIVYIRVDMPFPLSDRDYIVKYTTTKDSIIASHKFQAIKNDDITIRPIAGTRKRGKNSNEDNLISKDLLNDPKEIAEHLMLLDLGRNDVGRVSKKEQ